MSELLTAELQSPALPMIEALDDVYEVASDSRLLLHALARFGPAKSSSVVDLCCGSGVHAIAAALRGHTVDAIDSDFRAVAAARHNAKLNGVRIAPRLGHLFEPVSHRLFDVVLANPPYVPTPDSGELRRFPWCDGGPDGRAVIDEICALVHEYLAPGGMLLMVQSSLADTPKSIAQLEGSGLIVDRVAERLEPFGPISNERLDYLRRFGYAGLADTSELLTVLRARRAG